VLRRYCISSLFLLVAACSSHSPSSGSAAAPTDDVQQKAQQMLPQVFTGTLQQQNDQWVFSPCNSKIQWNIQTNSDIHGLWTQLGNPQSASATIAGTLTKPTERGGEFQLNASQVSVLSTEQNLCESTSSYVLKAGNNQPFWSLVMDAQKVSLTTSSGVSSFTLDDITQQTEGAYQLTFKNDDKNATLRLQPGQCVDPMNKDRVSGYEASLLVDGESPLSGCGELGHSLLNQTQPDQVWYGHDTTMNADVTLTLHSSYLAEMLYKNSKGPDVNYRGIWQRQNQNLTVIFNKRLGLPTDESIPFTVQTDQLKADYREFAAGRAYFDKPLVLKTNQTPDASANTAATAVPAGGNNMVMMAPPLSPSANDTNFAEQETVITGGSSAPQSATRAVASTSASVGAATTMSGFTAGMLKASGQTDNDIEAVLKNQVSGSSTLQYRYIKTDLNGDGQLDVLAEVNQCQPNQGCPVYVLQGQQGKFQIVGKLAGVDTQLAIAPSAHHNWCDVLIPATGQASLYRSYLFDGSSYQQQSAQPAAVSLSADALLQLDFTQNWLTSGQ
jgi:uncharacterized membrane protein